VANAKAISLRKYFCFTSASLKASFSLVSVKQKGRSFEQPFFIFCDPSWIRTSGRRFRKPVLYPAELWDQISLNSRIKLFFKNANVNKIII